MSGKRPSNPDHSQHGPPKKKSISKVICLDDFIGLSGELSDKIYRRMSAFQKTTTCTDEESEAFTQQVLEMCQEIVKANRVQNELWGFVADLNLFNIFALLKSYKQRVRQANCKQLLCATASGQIIRHFIERIIRNTDRFFLVAPCNGLHLPPELARAMYTLLSEVRSRAVHQGRMFGGGRMQIMKAGLQVVSVFGNLLESDTTPASLKAYMEHTFPVPSLDDVFKPLFKIEEDIRQQKASLTRHIHFTARRRCPNKSAFSDYDNKRFHLPETLLHTDDLSEPETHCSPDLSSLLQNPASTSHPVCMDPWSLESPLTSSSLSQPAASHGQPTGPQGSPPLAPYPLDFAVPSTSTTSVPPACQSFDLSPPVAGAAATRACSLPGPSTSAGPPAAAPPCDVAVPSTSTATPTLAASCAFAEPGPSSVLPPAAHPCDFAMPSTSAAAPNYLQQHSTETPFPPQTDWNSIFAPSFTPVTEPVSPYSSSSIQPSSSTGSVHSQGESTDVGSLSSILDDLLDGQDSSVATNSSVQPLGAQCNFSMSEAPSSQEAPSDPLSMEMFRIFNFFANNSNSSGFQ
nr:ORF50 R-transactivator-like protein [Ovine gammaherpesvirus 2]